MPACLPVCLSACLSVCLSVQGGRRNRMTGWLSTAVVKSLKEKKKDGYAMQTPSCLQSPNVNSEPGRR
ncbi:hypothetical protein B0T18DRAFT_103563 [Schizothecium vesticola]|uniref:Secreted protein n=1 Tax=Schizothecium vesticola TaxID=314040 RepID=A0AA40F1J3_9PEZI|nr:hypothetical protein B0T18DRAFT_103563 [Schizothecium vesticola]